MSSDTGGGYKTAEEVAGVLGVGALGVAGYEGYEHYEKDKQQDANSTGDAAAQAQPEKSGFFGSL